MQGVTFLIFSALINNAWDAEAGLRARTVLLTSCVPAHWGTNVYL